MKFSITKEEISKRLPWLIIGVGIILRICQYLYNRSLTEGEAALAMNIVQRSYSGLLRPLDYVQAAPIGFLFLQKSLINLFGNSEHSLRIFPLIAGISSLFLFYEVAKKTLDNWAIPISLILFATGDHLIYFSSEIKQYSSDVAITLLLFSIALYIFRNGLNLKWAVLLGLTGAITVWFSHPSVFTYSAIVLVLTIAIIRNRQWHSLIWLIFACLMWLVSLLCNYAISLASLIRHKEFLDFWQSSFMPLLIKSWDDIKWFPYAFLRLFKNPIGLGVYELLLSVLSFIVGSVVLWYKQRKIYVVLMLPIVLTLFASGMHKYPFEGRLLLFIVPSMVLVIAQGIDFIRSKTACSSNIIGILLVFVLLFYPVILAGYHLIKPRAPEELRTVMEYLKVHQEKGDVIYLYYAARNAFEYYSDKFGFEKNSYIIGAEPTDSWSDYYKDLARLKGNRRVWIIFSHIVTWRGVDEERLFISYLNLIGREITSFKTSGASAYLYDLSIALNSEFQGTAP